MKNKPLFIDVHALQTVPPSCVNRDDTGSPKTAIFGGSRRARVSSQAWKKAMRRDFAALLDDRDLGVRTKDVVGLIAESMVSLRPDMGLEDAMTLAAGALKATGISVKDGAAKYLVFIGKRQVDALAKLALTAHDQETEVATREARAILNPKERPTLNAIDVALFGRMVADALELNVDASVQVAHALGVSTAEPEYDYYTAMDERSPNSTAGAGMIGTVEYLSATLYRYATVDVWHLYENLGAVEAVERAVGAFLEAFACSMPTGKQHTFANRTLPAALVIQLRNTQPVNLSGAFERPVYAGEETGQVKAACKRLVEQEAVIDKAFGTGPTRSFLVCGAPEVTGVLDKMPGETCSLHEAVAGAVQEVTAYLRARGASCGGQD